MVWSPVVRYGTTRSVFYRTYSVKHGSATVLRLNADDVHGIRLVHTPDILAGLECSRRVAGADGCNRLNERREIAAE